MDCKRFEEQISLYILGELDKKSGMSMEQHMETCRGCADKIRAAGEAVASLAHAVPQLPAPQRVKAGVMAAVDKEIAGKAVPASRQHGLIYRSIESLFHRQAFRYAAAAVVLVVVGVISSGVWFNSRLNKIDAEKEALAGEVEAVAQEKAELYDMVAQQRYVTWFMATAPQVSVNRLLGSGVSANPVGMVMAPETGTVALLTATGLPILPPGKAYQVWLVRGETMYNAGIMSVDSTGYGQISMRLYAPLRTFDGIIITIEDEGGSNSPSGDSILRGDL